MRLFKSEYDAHVFDKKCPAKVCKKLLTYHVETDLCRKCGLCARNCAVNAITGVLGKEPYKIDANKCIRCGLCMTACRFGAIARV
jgi:ferredoxin